MLIIFLKSKKYILFYFKFYSFDSYKFYVIELTEIRPLCWFVPILLILLNYFRVQVIGDVGIGLSCDHSHHYYNNSSYYDDDHHRMLGSGDGDDVSYQVSHTCEEYLIPYALFCSGLLVFFAIIVVIITIHSKNKLLVLAGVKSEDDILNILRRLMVQEQYAARQQMQQESELPQESLPSTTSFEKNQMQDLTNETKKMSRQSSLFSFNTVPQEEYQVCTLRVMLHIHKEEQEAKAHQWLHTFYHYLFVISRIFQFKFNSRNQRTMTPMIERVKSMKLKAQLERTESGEVDSESENKEDDDDSCDIEMQIPFPYPKKDHDHGHDDEYLDPSTHPLAHEIHSVFPFSSRELYEFLIQEMLLLDSLFLALWATNFITMSLHSEHQVSYNLIFLVPIFLMTLLNFVIMFLSSTLFALTSLKNKGAEWICEQVDICQKVLPHLRREILTILPDGANDKRIVDLYRLITDTNISEKRDPQHPSTDEGIKLEGFAQFLQILDMHPSEKEIRALFRSMDKDDRYVC